MSKDCFMKKDDCTKDALSFMPESLLYGEAYTPYQQSTKTFCLEDALARGTLFPVLERPYMVNFF